MSNNNRFKLSIDAVDKLQEVDKKVRRAGFMLEEFIQEYGKKNERPNPYDAVTWLENRKTGEHDDKRFSAQWCFDYNRIIEILSMALDYNFEAELLLMNIRDEIDIQSSEKLLEVVAITSE
jgi:hypothetical protein